MVSRTTHTGREPRIPQTTRPLLVVIGDSVLLHATPQLSAATRNAGLDAQVVNLSVGGSGLSHTGFENWMQSAPFIAESMKRGDRVLINLSHNDFYAMGRRNGWDNSFLDRTAYMDRETYLRNYEQLVRTFQERGIHVHVAGPAPYLRPDPGASAFLDMHYTAATQRIPVLDRELATLSARLGVNYISMYENRALHDRSSRINDGLHPSEHGRQIMATQIAAGIANPRLQNTHTTEPRVAINTTPTTAPALWTLNSMV